MPIFEPRFQVADLQVVAPGTAVIFQNEIAFVGINQSAPQQLVILAAYDRQQQNFVYRYFDGVQPHVLVLDAELIIRPNLKSFAENVAVQPATTNLFMADEPYIVVQIPAGNDIRLMGVNTGSLVPVRTSQMFAFTSWELGFELRGEFVPLLQI